MHNVMVTLGARAALSTKAGGLFPSASLPSSLHLHVQPSPRCEQLAAQQFDWCRAGLHVGSGLALAERAQTLF